MTSLHNFFQCELIRPDATLLEPALAELSNTVSRCKFEASDSAGDEVTLLKIMTVIQDTMCGAVGDTLGDVEVCEMLETVLTTCCQMRLSGGFDSRLTTIISRIYSFGASSEILRRSAEATMHTLVKTAFNRLDVLDPEEEERRLTANDGQADGEVKLCVSASASSSSAPVASEEISRTDPPEASAELKEPTTEVVRTKCMWS